ncbi:MAG: phosphate ABC transporter permease subunit PstC [Tissierellia bacterium]|nr:phosphate ABC transporter permease subunit PstC [Tissierellia bacterium]
MRGRRIAERLMKWVFILASAISIIAFLFICYFIFKSGLPFLGKVGVFNVLGGSHWQPTHVPPQYGILPMIFGSVIITVLACIIGVPFAIFSAIYLTWEVSKKVYAVLKPLLNLMAGIPSIVYGFFALQWIVPLVKDSLGGKGYSILTAAILLGIMILPTILSIAEAAIQAVPKFYYEASVALGASHSRSVIHIVVPAAKSGILAAIILGVGRAIGETMAVSMVVGNQPRITWNILKGIRTMTTNVVLEMGYAAGDHQKALLATACVLFIFILLINLTFLIIKKRGANNG